MTLTSSPQSMNFKRL